MPSLVNESSLSRPPVQDNRPGGQLSDLAGEKSTKRLVSDTARPGAGPSVSFNPGAGASAMMEA
jgi:hypothetical protein